MSDVVIKATANVLQRLKPQVCVLKQAQCHILYEQHLSVSPDDAPVLPG